MRKISGICLVSRDVLKLREFYQAVLQVEAEGNAEFTWFTLNGIVLSIYFWQGMENLAPGSMADAGTGRCLLEFEVDDVDAEHQRLVALNIPIVKPPTTQPWGLRSVWLRDPDGNIVNFFARVAVD